MKKVAIIHGLTEGPRHSRKLEVELRKQALEVVKDPKKADVVLTHSGGCYVIPADSKAEVAIMCGVPHWPGRKLPGRLIKKTTGDFLGYKSDQGTVKWLKKMNWNIYYFFARPKHNLKMWRAYKPNRDHFNLNIPKTVLLQNDQDYFANSSAVRELASKNGWDVYRFAGQHDDIWENPEPYAQTTKDLPNS
ncbi:hypothetical protein HYX70_04985 [Candidatus Saccharibacteria bacterium]|nr:hypothetical protein [Candidatus Saccharibacteria bacterium]